MRFIPVAKPNISIAEASAVFQVIKNGWISMGKKVNQFEKIFQNLQMLNT